MFDMLFSLFNLFLQVESAPAVEPVVNLQPTSAHIDLSATTAALPVKPATNIHMPAAVQATVAQSTPPTAVTATKEPMQPVAPSVPKAVAKNQAPPTTGKVPPGGVKKTGKPSVASAFGDAENESKDDAPKRHLVPIDYTEEEQQAVGRTNVMSAEQKRAAIKQLIERIPTIKEDLFAYSLKWFLVDKVSRDVDTFQFCWVRRRKRLEVVQIVLKVCTALGPLYTVTTSAP